jgi:hypothetical protein
LKMAKRKQGHRIIFVEAPEDLARRLKDVARRNHRSMTGEAVLAIEEHVNAQATDPALPVASAAEGPRTPAAKRKSGRSRKP